MLVAELRVLAQHITEFEIAIGPEVPLPEADRSNVGTEPMVTPAGSDTPSSPEGTPGSERPA